MAFYYLSEAAERDIEEIVLYMADKSPKVAYTFLDALYNAMENLANNPHLGHLREDLIDKPIKFFTFKWHYLIVYRETEFVEIIRVLSGYRDVGNIVKDE